MSLPTNAAANRRDFLKLSLAGSALAAATPSLAASIATRAIGANDRIRIGLIGCGGRSRNAHQPALEQHANAANLEVVAIADPWKKAREETSAKLKTMFGRAPAEYVSYRELLADPNVDAVMIASPDHLHTKHLEAAARAKKHIYVEKPLATDFDQLVRSVDAARAAGTVIQVGTQMRSLPAMAGARDVMRSGVLGKISLIEEKRNGEKPYWYNSLSRKIRPEDVDWKEFLGDVPARPFNATQYAAWYGYYEFCQGPVPQWGAHFLDTVHFLMDSPFPESCMCTGSTFTWVDENKFTTPDCVQATWIYPGYMVTSANNFGNSSGNSRKFFGTKGTLALDSWHTPVYSAEGGPKRDGSVRGKTEVPAVEAADHFLNWFQCMRTGETPRASIEEGYKNGVAVLMAVKSYETGKKTFYDAKQRRLTTA